MSLHPRWFSQHRKAQHPPDPRFPLGIMVDGTAGRPSCSVALQYPAPCVGKWLILRDVCGIFVLVSAAGRVDDPHTVRLPCKTKGNA